MVFIFWSVFVVACAVTELQLMGSGCYLIGCVLSGHWSLTHPRIRERTLPCAVSSFKQISDPKEFCRKLFILAERERDKGERNGERESKLPCCCERGSGDGVRSDVGEGDF